MEILCKNKKIRSQTDEDDGNSLSVSQKRTRKPVFVCPSCPLSKWFKQRQRMLWLIRQVGQGNLHRGSGDLLAIR